MNYLSVIKILFLEVNPKNILTLPLNEEVREFSEGQMVLSQLGQDSIVAGKTAITRLKLEEQMNKIEALLRKVSKTAIA